MKRQIILASGSNSRQKMMRQAGVSFTSTVARIDEDSIKASLLADDANARDVADTLAEFKARRVAQLHPEALVIGSDQILEFERGVLSKPTSPQDAIAQLTRMSGKQHKLLSSAVIYEDAKPAWRSVGRPSIPETKPDHQQASLIRAPASS